MNKNTIARNSVAALVRSFRNAGHKVLRVTPAMQAGFHVSGARYLCTGFQYIPAK